MITEAQPKLSWGFSLFVDHSLFVIPEGNLLLA